MTEVTIATQEAAFPSDPGHDYWNAFIDEKVAADFLDCTPRKMQAMRQHGDGPQFFRFSARCVKYTRLLLKSYADARIRSSTSDPGKAAA